MLVITDEVEISKDDSDDVVGNDDDHDDACSKATMIPVMHMVISDDDVDTLMKLEQNK
jgi:hypothetical protein